MSEKLRTLLLVVAVMILTALAMIAFYEIRYEISFSNKICQEAGFKAFRGVDYVAVESSTDGSKVDHIEVRGILCKSDEGLRFVNIVNSVNTGDEK